MSQLALMLTTASIAVLLFVSPVQASKRSGSDKDINAIGKRTVVPKGSNWYSPQKEAELGKQQSSDFEKSVTLLRDPVMTDYVGQVAGKIARNSDADMPITVQVVGSDEEFAFTLAGGTNTSAVDCWFGWTTSVNWQPCLHAVLPTPPYILLCEKLPVPKSQR